MSRSFVGSSRSRTSAGSSISLAMTTRACSPPDSRLTGVSSCSGRNMKRFAQPTTWIDRPLKMTASPVAPRVCLSDCVGIETRAMLIEHHDLQTLGVGHRAAVRLLGSREHPHQRGLAAAVAAEKAEPQAGRESEVELRDDGPVAVTLGEVLRHDELLGPPFRGREVDADRGLLRPSVEVGEFALHASRLVDPGLGLARARLGLAREPHQFAAHAVAQRILVGGLAGQKLVLLLEVSAVVAGHIAHAEREGLVQLDHPTGDRFEEVAIVADGDEGLGLAGQQVFEPQDAFEVEMVRGLVEEEQLGLADQLDGDGEALLPAPGEDRGLRVGVVEARLPHHDGDVGVDFVGIEMSRP